MSIFSRFFGKFDIEDTHGGELTANPKIKHPLSLQVVFPDQCPLDSIRLIEAFRSYHHSMSRVRCEIDPVLSGKGNMFGMIGWGKHVVRCVGFDLPMPPETVERCVAPSHYPQELKDRARSHKAHVILYYAGYDPSLLEQYVALAATAGVMAQFGAIVVLNESGCTSFPTAALSSSNSDGDILDLLRTLPLPILYCGFVKYEIEEIPGVWMRTYGAPLLGLPDFAAHTVGHHEAQRYFDIFDNVLNYLRDSGSQLSEGHTMQIGSDEYLKFRAPNDVEDFLESDEILLVVEIISADEINC